MGVLILGAILQYMVSASLFLMVGKGLIVAVELHGSGARV